MDYKTFDIKGLIEINLSLFQDDRGFFKEVFRADKLDEVLGFEFVIKQMNHSNSSKNTLRGIHSAPWNKLIYATKGRVQSVIIDLRPDSATYKQHQSFEIGENTKKAIFVPKDCGNSYLVLSENADYVYLTDEQWAPNKETSVAWNDPTLNINWQLDGAPILSEKDKINPPLK